MSWKIGVDGGGTKTECILVDPSGSIVARHTGPGCSPSLVGGARAAEITAAVLDEVRASNPSAEVSATLLCMAGSRAFWKDFGSRLKGFGRVETADDSVPVLELATRGAPGLVIHAGTGSFIAARTPDGMVHYAGGTGWRFGDEGSGYDSRERAMAARALLELKGWAPPSGLGALVRERTGHSTAGEVSVYFYGDPATNNGVAGLAPEVLRLASSGDPAAAEAVSGHPWGSFSRARGVGDEPAVPPGKRPDFLVPRGRQRPHPQLRAFAFQELSSKAPFPLSRVTQSPIEGVRLLLARMPG